MQAAAPSDEYCDDEGDGVCMEMFPANDLGLSKIHRARSAMLADIIEPVSKAC